MYSIHLAEPSKIDAGGICLRKQGFEIIDSIAIQTPDRTIFGFLCRKNDYSSMVEEAIREGKGALLDIDRGRISTGPEGKAKAGGGKLWSHYRDQTQDQADPDKYQENKGRFPTNTILVHHEQCERKGKKKVEGAISVNKNREGDKPNEVYGTYGTDLPDYQGYADEDGKETVDDWDCHPTCPVGLLDRQSFEMGIHGAGHNRDHVYDGGYESSSYDLGGERQMDRYGDKGGASRFFYQARSLEETIKYLKSIAHDIRKIE